MRFLAHGMTLLVISTTLVLSCKKHDNPNPASTIQHKWEIVSITGEAYYYMGQPADYWDFRSNDTLIQFLRGKYDTSNYTLSNNGKTLAISEFNGVGVGLATNVKVLTNSQLILSGTGSPSFPLLDSFRR
jgi:hypothetical protein